MLFKADDAHVRGCSGIQSRNVATHFSKRQLILGLRRRRGHSDVNNALQVFNYMRE